MTEIEARDVIQTAIFGGVFTGLTNATDIAWQGKPFDVDTERSYIRVTIFHEQGTQLTLGSPGGARKFRRNGVLIVQCFVPATDQTHMEDVVTIATEVKNLFEGSTLSAIRFADAIIREAPPIESEWLQANAEVTFQYDEQK